MKARVLLVAGNTFRARSYAQVLSKRDDIQLEGLFYGFENSNIIAPTLNEETRMFFQNNSLCVPNLNESLIETFDKNKQPYTFISSKDVNSNEILSSIKGQNPDYVVYAGYGGQILSKSHFASGIIYLHAHPGLIPEERGSTTIYYSILNRSQCGVSVFIMDDKIDAGKLLLKENYHQPAPSVNIDVWYDNVIRADSMNKALESMNSGRYKTELQTGEINDYFIIHPLLKHIAILSL